MTKLEEDIAPPELPAPEPLARARRDHAPWVLLTASVLIQIPFVDRGLSYVDEGSILAIAESLRTGAVLYRDNVTFIAPLVYELTAVLHRLFGPHLLVSRIFAALVFSACTLLVYRILRELVPRRWALLGGVAFLAVKPLAFPLWTILNYSQLAMVFTLVSMLALLRYIARGRSGWLVVAGLGIGLTVVTKQNAGAVLVAIVGISLIMHAWRHGIGTARFFGESALVAGGTVPPIIALVVYYASRGALGDFIEHAVVGLRDYAPHYNVWLPGLEIWSLRPELFGWVIFAYFPTPLWHVSWEAMVDLRSLPIFMPCELLIRLTYLGPFVAMLYGEWQAVRTRRDPHSREWSALVLVVIAAVLSYASMLYRADWAHLMNVYPPLLIMAIVALARVARTPAARRAAVAVVGVWMLAGVAVAVAIVLVYRVPVETPRARILGPSFEAYDANRVLQYLDGVPAERRVAFFRGEPLYYFLSARPMPTAFDLVMPAYLRPGDDARIAHELGSIDEVIYNPKLMATIPGAITDYAPETANVLWRDFEIASILSPTAFVLRRRKDPLRPSVQVLDLWQSFVRLRPELRRGARVAPLPGDIQRQVTQTSWMVFRVIGALILDRSTSVCFTLSYTPHAGEALSTIPMLHPERWIPGERDLSPEERDTVTRGARFDVIARRADGSETTILSEERRAEEIPRAVSVDLDRLAGETIDLRFCATADPSTPPGPAYLPAGWAEPRIVRASDAMAAR